MNKQQEKKAVHSAIESGEIEKYDRNFFVNNGKVGFQEKTKGKTKKEISEMMRRVSLARFKNKA